MNRDAPYWRDQAKCASHDPEMFYTNTVAAHRYALAVCGLCPVQTQCLTETLKHESLIGESYGIAGGMLAGARRRLIARSA